MAPKSRVDPVGNKTHTPASWLPGINTKFPLQVIKLRVSIYF